MEAYFDQYNHPITKIVALGKKQKKTITAILDTGFDGHLSLPLQIAIQLGLELVNVIQVQYADGRISSELVFLVNIDFGGKVQSVRTTLTNSTEALVGTAMFSSNKITFDFPRKKITIA